MSGAEKKLGNSGGGGLVAGQETWTRGVSDQ